MKNKKLKTVYIGLLGALILIIGISRVYLGVHYMTDIIGAYIFATIYLIAFVKFVSPKIDKIKWKTIKN